MSLNVNDLQIGLKNLGVPHYFIGMKVYQGGHDIFILLKEIYLEYSQEVQYVVVRHFLHP